MKRARPMSEILEDLIEDALPDPKRKCLTVPIKYDFVSLEHGDERLVKDLMDFDPSEWMVCKCMNVVRSPDGKRSCQCIDLPDCLEKSIFRLNLMEPITRSWSYYSKYAIPKLNRMILPHGSTFKNPIVKTEEKYATHVQEAACMFLYQKAISDVVPHYIEPDLWNLVHQYFVAHRVEDVSN